MDLEFHHRTRPPRPHRLWGVGGGHLSLEVGGAEGAAVGRPSEPPRPPLAAVQQRCNQRLTDVLLLPRCFFLSLCRFQCPQLPEYLKLVFHVPRLGPTLASVRLLYFSHLSPLSFLELFSSPFLSSLHLLTPVFPFCVPLSPHLVPFLQPPPLVSASPTSRLSPTPFWCLSHLLAPVSPSSSLPLPPSFFLITLPYLRTS